MHLINGLAGTGKTHTLIGLISCLYYYKSKTNSKKNIMVCAPSNTALDIIIRKFINSL